MRAILILTVALFFVLAGLPAVAEEESPKKGTFRVDLPSGLHYFCHVHDEYEPGKTGIAILFHGRGGSGEDMLSYYRDSGFLKSFNWIGVAPKSPDMMWESGHKGGMEALQDVMSKYKIDKTRVHLHGFSAGGLYAGWFGLSNIEMFRSITVSGACLDNGPLANVKKKLKMPIYLINGETCQYESSARSNHEALLRFGCRYARRHVHPGEPHSYDVMKDVERLREWYAAIESGYDYADALDAANKTLKSKIEKSIEKVKEIESNPHEEGFWKELDILKKAINEAGEKKLKGVLSRARTSPDRAAKELEEFIELFEGYDCAEKAKEELKKYKPEEEEKPEDPDEE
jgi:predicted esterase